MPDQALEDVRVIDLSQGVAGPYCGKLLADFGAEVIKIEPPEGDWTRRRGPFPEDLPHPEKSGLFLHLNTNKKSVTLDITTASGQVILKKLLANADVLVESNSPGHLAQFGLGYDDLKGEFPRLVYASITPFGQSGPYRDYRGNSFIAMAMSGLMYNTGNPDREPLVTGGEPAEFLAGQFAWMGTLAALAQREKTGAGQQVDISLMESACATDEYNTSLYSFFGAIRRRYYSRHHFGYPSDIFPCRDGYVVVIPGATGFPANMAILLDDPDLMQNPLFLSASKRILEWEEFDKLALPWLTSHTADEIVAKAQELRMPFAFVPTVEGLLTNPHLQERAFFATVEHPEAGKVTQTGEPFKLSETPMRVGRAPLLGEHSSEILMDLGYSKEDLIILRERGII